jgi:hypothetical protein
MRARVQSFTLVGMLALAACSPAPEASVPAPSDDADAATPTVAAPALTPAQQTAWDALLHRLDRDGNGVVERGEHTVAAAVMFARMDRDGDEAVTVEEMDSERESLLDTAPNDTAQRLAEVDANHDGKLDSDEHDAATALMFKRWDRNGDARLVREEFLAVLPQLEAAQ